MINAFFVIGLLTLGINKALFGIGFVSF